MPDIVYELSSESRAIAKPLFSAATYDRVFVDAYFEGRQIGRIFVDDPQHPTGALLCRSYEYFAVGETVPALRRFIADAPQEVGLFQTLSSLEIARRNPTIAFYGFVAMTPAWNDALLEIHPGLESIGRRAFRYPAADADQAIASAWDAPEGFTLHAIDEALARRIDVELDELIALFWGDYASFAAGGLGVCAMAGDEIASVAYAIAASETEANIGVGTVEAFQRRGLAGAVCRATIAQAIERGVTPTWDCDVPNTTSAHLALRLGFREEPSFIELAFPDRAGPALTSGLWTSQPSSTGRIWTR
ncbi:MAG: GNAT family N-acetyltransferase [Thermomicrobiales bacterium]|nr:GNAT family N-acetyltransferase [Thermomicrobiales bacterium]